MQKGFMRQLMETMSGVNLKSLSVICFIILELIINMRKDCTMGMRVVISNQTLQFISTERLITGNISG